MSNRIDEIERALKTIQEAEFPDVPQRLVLEILRIHRTTEDEASIVREIGRLLADFSVEGE